MTEQHYEFSTSSINDLLAFVRLYVNAGYTVSASKIKNPDTLAFEYFAVATKEK